MYKITVPLFAQKKSDTCWHASSLMIWSYWQGQTGIAGPMNTLAPQWSGNQPLYPTDFINLANKVGLKALPQKPQHTAVELEELLKQHGPIWCAGYWYGPGHIIVLTGIDDQIVMLNDPDGGRPKMGDLDWFNDKLASNLAGAMMVKSFPM